MKDPDNNPPLHPSIEAIEEEIAAMEAQLETHGDEMHGEERQELEDGSLRLYRQSASLDPNQEGAPADKKPGGRRLPSTERPDTDRLDRESPDKEQREDVGPKSLILSTFLSLAVVLVLLTTVRLGLPQLLEWCRYSWTRGQMRAEYEISGQQLRQVSLDGLTQISQLLEKRVNPCVVHIDVRQDSEEGKADSPRKLDRLLDWDHVRIEQGSGVLVDTEGLIITNHHVVEDRGRIEITLHDGRVVPGKVIGNDPETDLAVIKIDAPDIMAITWGDSDRVSVGMPVWAIGSPFGLTGSVTFGILSGKHRIDLSSTRLQGSVKSQAEYSDLMQSDVAVNPGNSGGPLVNAQGELIGINTAIIGESFRGVSFSIPSNVAHRVYDKILSTGKMERGVLGILIDEKYQPKKDGSGRVGARVKDFTTEHSPARQAGIVPGDILIRVAGRDVSTLQDLRRIVGESYVGDTVEVVVWRVPNEITFEVEVAPNPFLNR